jgi:hypothetical protein
MVNRIDPSLLRAAIRHMPKDDVYQLLDRAVGLLSQKGLRQLIKGFLKPTQLEVDGERRTNLLQDIHEFQESSLQGKYSSGIG